MRDTTASSERKHQTNTRAGDEHVGKSRPVIFFFATPKYRKPLLQPSHSLATLSASHTPMRYAAEPCKAATYSRRAMQTISTGARDEQNRCNSSAAASS